MTLDQLTQRISAEFWDSPPFGVTPAQRVDVYLPSAQFGALLADFDARGGPSHVEYDPGMHLLSITVFHDTGPKRISVEPTARENGSASMRGINREVAL